MKTVYLILYFWHADLLSHTSQPPIATAGAPVLHFERMPSLGACEVIGAAAKKMIDAEQMEPRRIESASRYLVAINSMNRPVAYRCIEVASK